MAPTNVFFDVWVNGPSQPPFDSADKRSALLRRIEAVHPVAKSEGAQFVAGARLRLRRGIDQDAALRIVAELQNLGVSVEVEPNRPPEEAILALDQFNEAEPETSTGPNIDESILARLATIDGEDTQAKTKPRIDREAATIAGGSPRSGAADSPAAGAAGAAAAAAVAAVAAADDDDDARFRPRSDQQAPVDLQIDRPPPPPPRPLPPPTEAEPYPTRDDEAPIHVAQPWKPIPGRIANGALRKNPPLRIGIGVVLALGLGYVIAQPYARRVERHVAELRAEADHERYRPVDEAQARVRRLDDEADDTASSGAVGTAVIWLLVGGAAFAGWWRAT